MNDIVNSTRLLKIMTAHNVSAGNLPGSEYADTMTTQSGPYWATLAAMKGDIQGAIDWLRFTVNLYTDSPVPEYRDEARKASAVLNAISK